MPDTNEGYLVTVEGGVAEELLPPGVDKLRVTIWDWDNFWGPFWNNEDMDEKMAEYEKLPQWMKDHLNGTGTIDQMKERLLNEKRS